MLGDFVRRAVLVGCGSMARGWVQALSGPALANELTIAALVDTNANAAIRLRDDAELKGVQISTDLGSILSIVKPDIVLDVVVPSARFGVVTAALEYGAHVLSEKPMASSLKEARQLVQLASDTGKVHAVVQNRRYVSGVRRIRRMIESGALGELTALHADFFIGAHFGGFRDEMRNVLLLDMAIHTFDAARFMSGKDPRAVYSHEGNPRGSWYAHGAAANAIFEFSDDVVFTYRGSWAAEGANTSWESMWRIVGTRGTLLWDGADRFDAHIVNGHEGFHRPLAALEVLPPADDSQIGGHESVIGEFINAIDTGRQPETAGADNIKSLAMVFAAIESARTQTRQAIGPEVLI
ncbi:MAG: Gfo/Idh/MocA family oxidoreductase [Devosia sp.]